MDKSVGAGLNFLFLCHSLFYIGHEVFYFSENFSKTIISDKFSILIKFWRSSLGLINFHQLYKAQQTHFLHYITFFFKFGDDEEKNAIQCLVSIRHLLLKSAVDFLWSRVGWSNSWIYWEQESQYYLEYIFEKNLQNLKF